MTLSGPMKQFLKRDDIANAIRESNFVKLYEEALHYGKLMSSELTMVLYSLGLDPLIGMQLVPSGFMYHNTNTPLSIRLPNAIKKIDVGAFTRTINLHQIHINSGCEEIGEMAFGGSGLLKVAIPNTVDAIWDHAFEFCKNLETVTFEPNSNLTYIASSAFKKCDKLQEIYLPDSVEALGDECFARTRIRLLKLPKNIRVFGEGCIPNRPDLTIKCYKHTFGDMWANKNNFNVEYI